MNDKVEAAFVKLANQYAGGDMDGMTAIFDEIKPYVGDGSEAERIAELEATVAEQAAKIESLQTELSEAKSKADKFEAVAAKATAQYMGRYFGRDTSEPPLATVVDNVGEAEEEIEERQDDDEPRQLVFDFDNK